MLPGAVQAALAQTYTQIEVILVDDGSKDNTPEVAGDLLRQDCRVRYLRQDNARLPAALNTGHAAARGEYLTWTSDDNLFLPEAIEIMVRCLRESPEVGLVYCDMRHMSPDGEDLGDWEWTGPPEILPERNPVGGCFLYPSKVYQALGGYATDLFLAEDYDYWLRIWTHYPVKYLEGVRPYLWRHHPGSLTLTRQADCLIAVGEARLRNLHKPKDRKRVMAAAHGDVVVAMRENGDLKTAMQYACKCVALNPVRPLYWKYLVGTAYRVLTQRNGVS